MDPNNKNDHEDRIRMLRDFWARREIENLLERHSPSKTDKYLGMLGRLFGEDQLRRIRCAEYQPPQDSACKCPDDSSHRAQIQMLEDLLIRSTLEPTLKSMVPVEAEKYMGKLRGIYGEEGLRCMLSAEYQAPPHGPCMSPEDRRWEFGMRTLLRSRDRRWHNEKHQPHDTLQAGSNSKSNACEMKKASPRVLDVDNDSKDKDSESKDSNDQNSKDKVSEQPTDALSNIDLKDKELGHGLFNADNSTKNNDQSAHAPDTDHKPKDDDASENDDGSWDGASESTSSWEEIEDQPRRYLETDEHNSWEEIEEQPRRVLDTDDNSSWDGIEEQPPRRVLDTAADGAENNDQSTPHVLNSDHEPKDDALEKDHNKPPCGIVPRGYRRYRRGLSLFEYQPLPRSLSYEPRVSGRAAPLGDSVV